MNAPRHDGAPGGDQGQPANVTAKRLAQYPTGEREKPLTVAIEKGPDPSQSTDLDRDDLAVFVLTAADARALTDRIKKNLTFCYGLFVEAFEGAAWSALGYESWDAYCADEFPEARMVRLDPGQRREIVANMRQARMSTRAIASSIGVSQSTVALDLSTESNNSVEQQTTVKSLDGVVRPATQPHRAPIAAPTARRRRPLPDALFDAINDLTKCAERVTKLTQDDRFPALAERVASKHRGDLMRIHEALTGALAALPQSESPS